MRCPKSWSPVVILLSINILWACSDEPSTQVSHVSTKPFLDQPPPGDTAVLFAPGLVSVEGRYEYGVSFSPEGDELFVTTQLPEGPSRVVHFLAENSGWVGPQSVNLTGGLKAEEMEAFFTPDGQKVYFAAYNEGLDVRIWAVDRVEGDWLSPRELGPPVSDGPAFFPTTTADGTVYYSDLTERRTFRARMFGDSVGGAEDAGFEGMHAFISPDESFVLVDARVGGKRADIFVAFRQPNGEWTDLVDLGPGVNTEYSETCPSLSHDGQFIFFSRYNEANDVSNIYWVSARLIQAARTDLADRR
jgi:hypothetical protein